MRRIHKAGIVQKLRIVSAPFLMVALLCNNWACLIAANDKLACESSPLSWQGDAELTDVFFLNSNIGWAVGAQGVILRTTNGGQVWQELGQANPDQVVQDLPLQQKIQAMQQGVRTQVTGIADGRSEQSQKLRCRFESVFFIDEQNGWVAGGYHVPYLNHSRCVLLRTTDGGVTWRRVTGALMPRIKRIHFSDRSHGWAVGDRGNLLRGSLFYTTDGGESWSNQSLQTQRRDALNYLDADVTERGLVAIDSNGMPLTIKNGREESAVFEGRGVSSSVNLKRIRMLDQNQGLSVGDGGAIWRTQNAGLSWSNLTNDPDSAMEQQFRHFDFQTLAVSPTKIWFAGNPGTQIFSIDRVSGEILSYSTGVATPISGLHFVDDNTGWFVGALGTIMSTTDGGRSWQRQHGKHRSVAILGIAFDQRELPLEALAQFGCEDDQLVAIATIAPVMSDAAVQSIERLGAAGLYSISLKPGANSPKQEQEQQLERLVRLIRTLKPNVILCNSEYRKRHDLTGNSHAAFDPYLLLAAAVRAAADRESYSGQLEIAKLETWTVDRIAYRVPAGSLSIEPQRMLIRLGNVLEDQIAISRGLNGLALNASEKKSYRIDAVSNIRLVNETDLFSGLSQGGRVIPKRFSDTRLRTNRSAIELANRKQQKLFEFAQFVATTEQDFVVWNQKVLEWLSPIDDALAGIWLAQLSDRYLEQGKIELAAKCLELLSARYYGHALYAPSLLWLARYYASDEFGRLELATLSKNQLLQTAAKVSKADAPTRIGQPSSKTYSSHQNGQTILVWAPVADRIELPNRNGSTNGTESMEPADDSSAEQLAVQTGFTEENVGAAAGQFGETEVQAFLKYRWRLASHYLTQLSQLDPDLINHLQLRFMEANLKRKLGGNSMAEGSLKSIVQANETIAGLSKAAQQELRLIDRSNETIASSIRSFSTRERPYLDGQLDDPVWQQLMRNQQELRMTCNRAGDISSGGSDATADEKPDLVLFAHDDEFLFIAVRNQKLPGQFYQISNDARPRDPELNRRDRVEFCFDVDRDYQTGFQFVVDYRGWGAEDVNGAKGWNPQWFIARGEDAESWTVELAIPLEAFVASPVQGGEVWAVRLSRRSGEGRDLWKSSASSTQDEQNQELSVGLYQRILARPADFQFFTFQ